jgi:hypothetical protein
VSPQVADVVEKVMSEESSLIENQESYNLSNTSLIWLFGSGELKTLQMAKIT